MIEGRKPWKSEMSPRERFLAQMNGKDFDRCFNFEAGFCDDALSNWPLFHKNHIVCNEEASVYFGFDPLSVMEGYIWMSPPFERRIIEQNGDRYVMQNSDGCIVETLPGSFERSARHMKSVVQNPDEWMKLKEDRLWFTDLSRRANFPILYQRYPQERNFPLLISTGSLIGNLCRIMTTRELSEACERYPEMVEDMAETLCVIIERSLDELLPGFIFEGAVGFECVELSDEMPVPLPFFRDVFLPRYERIAAKLQWRGVKLWGMKCTANMYGYLPLMQKIGVNCCILCDSVLDFAHTVPHDNLKLMGGIDLNTLIAGQDAIESFLESIRPMVESGGYIPYCARPCVNEVTQKNYLYYLEQKARLFGMR